MSLTCISYEHLLWREKKGFTTEKQALYKQQISNAIEKMKYHWIIVVDTHNSTDIIVNNIPHFPHVYQTCTDIDILPLALLLFF
jgi:adenylate kinase